MTKEIFMDCMKKLAALSPRPLTKEAAEVIWNRLEEHKISDEVMRKTTDRLIDNHHFRAFPAISEILDMVHEVRIEIAEQKHDEQRRKENQYRHLSKPEMLAMGLRTNTNPAVKAMIRSTFQLLIDGDVSAWKNRHLELVKDDSAAVGILKNTGEPKEAGQ